MAISQVKHLLDPAGSGSGGGAACAERIAGWPWEAWWWSGRAAGESVDAGGLLGSGELARANGRRVVRMVDFKGKS
jgi:hypothetical protein